MVINSYLNLRIYIGKLQITFLAVKLEVFPFSYAHNVNCNVGVIRGEGLFLYSYMDHVFNITGISW